MNNTVMSAPTPNQQPPMPDLPDDITTAILTKLPVKSLLRFDVVSKQWHSWISCPESELSKQRRLKGAQAAIALEKHNNQQFSFYLIDQQKNFQNLENPLLGSSVYKGGKQVCLLGSCDGLLLISVDVHIFLWNPATRFITKMIELGLLTSDEFVISGSALCFDSSENEYKVLLQIFKNFSFEVFPLVASLKDKEWREISYNYWWADTGISMPGRIYWIAGRERRSLWPPDHGIKWMDYRNTCIGDEVIYFDVISEEFHSLYERERSILGLGVIDDSLCMACQGSNAIEIWIMKEYDGEPSWTHLFVIRNFEITRFYTIRGSFFMTDNRELTLLVYLRNGSYGIVVYDPTTDSVKRTFWGNSLLLPVVTYVESLVKPTGYDWTEGMRSLI